MLSAIVGNTVGDSPVVEVFRIAKLWVIRALALLTTIMGAVALLTIQLLKKLRHPATWVAGLRDRALLWPWLTHSTKLVLGTLAYNAFVFLLVEPILRRWFPPLKPWEHVQGVFAGSTRTTYDDILPVVATALWIAGNALVITLLNRRLQVVRDVE